MDATLRNNRQSFFFSLFSLCRFLSFLRRSPPFLSVPLILPSLFAFSLFSILSFSRSISFLLFLILLVLCWAFLSFSLFGSFWYHFIPLLSKLFCFLSFLLFSLAYSNYFSLSVFSFFSSFPHALFISALCILDFILFPMWTSVWAPLVWKMGCTPTKSNKWHGSIRFHPFWVCVIRCECTVSDVNVCFSVAYVLER